MRPLNYQNFDLYIDLLSQGGCRAKVTASPRGQAEDVLTWPPAQAAPLPSWSGARPPGATLPAQADLLAAASRFFAPLLAGAVGDLLVRSLDAVGETGEGLRLRLHLADGSLAALPWELLPHPAGDRFLALDPHTPVVRYLDLSAAARPLLGAGPLTVLAVLAAPADLPPIDVEAEWQGLRDAFAPLQAQGLVQVWRLPFAGAEPLAAFLRRGACHVLHFVGHGLLDPRGGESALAFCDAEGAAVPIRASDLALLLRGQAELRLVFLNACHGAAGQHAASAGVAQQLVRAGLPAVIAMQGAVEMGAAQALAQAFYSGLAAFLPVDAALGAARQSLWLRSREAAHAASYDWALPVLFTRADDNVLLARPTATALGDASPGEASQAAAPAPELQLAPYEPPTVSIPAGPFTMGRPAGMGATPGESPAHRVTLPAFRIGRTPVTNAQYAHFVRATRQPVAPELAWQLAGIGQVPPPGREDHPVTGVTWDEAVHYCRWLSESTGRRYRLPSEAEWERAARGAEGRLYPWGDEFDVARCNAAPGGRGQTTAVRAYSPGGDSPEGVADLAGNVWEWTGTAWGRDPNVAEYGYPYQADDGRENPAPAPGPLRELRICRGGSFGDGPERMTGSARRRQAADSRSRRCGLRVVLEVES